MPSRIPYHKPLASALARRASSRHYEQAEARREDKRFYCSTRWRRLRAAFLAKHPLCVDCLGRGLAVPGLHVDHVEPRKRRPDLAFEESNLQALCQPCHNAKRAREGDPGNQCVPGNHKANQ